MNKELKQIIQSRALRLFPYLADFLTYQDQGAHEEGHCYRYTFLILKGPRAFLEAFKFGELRIDPDAVESVFWQMRGEISGQAGIMNEERQVISTHNQEVELYQRTQRSQAVRSMHV